VFNFGIRQQLLSSVNQTDRRLTAGVVNCCKWSATLATSSESLPVLLTSGSYC